MIEQVSPLPSPEDGRKTSLRNVVILYFYILSGRWTKSRRQLVLNVKVQFSSTENTLRLHRKEKLVKAFQTNYRSLS
jgi:hypothetical protein